MLIFANFTNVANAAPQCVTAGPVTAGRSAYEHCEHGKGAGIRQDGWHRNIASVDVKFAVVTQSRAASAQMLKQTRTYLACVRKGG